jgi:hypothetical protein
MRSARPLVGFFRFWESVLSTAESKVDLTIAHEEAPDSEADAKEKGAYAYARYAVQNDYYLGHYEDWSKSILFLLRKHWWNFDRKRRRYVPDADVPPWRQQPVNNLVFAVFRSLIAKLTKQRPTLETIAPSQDTEALESAELGKSALEDLHIKLKDSATDKRFIAWILCTGLAWRRVYWDPFAGRMVPRTTTVDVPDPTALGGIGEKEVACDEDGEPYRLEDGSYDFEKPPEVYPEGEIGDHVENRFCVRLNPEAESIEDATEMFVVRVMPKVKAATTFDLEVEELDDSVDDMLELYTDLITASAASPDDSLLGKAMGPSQNEAKGDQCLVLEYYAKPDIQAGYPEGRHWIQVGRVPVTEEVALPEGFWPPLVPCADTPVPGQVEPIGVIPQVVPLNERFNYVDGKILEHEVTMAMGGKWVVHPDDKNLKITSDPAQVMASKGYVQGKATDSGEDGSAAGGSVRRAPAHPLADSVHCRHQRHRRRREAGRRHQRSRIPRATGSDRFAHHADAVGVRGGEAGDRSPPDRVDAAVLLAKSARSRCRVSAVSGW